jgi:predicted flavoprotein YhiN
MKAAPLLRAWLQLLRRGGVQFSMRHRWLGWDQQGQLVFETPVGLQRCPAPAALVLALGGGSWARLGSDGRWVATLVECGPGKVLAGMCKRIDPELTGLALYDPASLADIKGALA